MLRALIAAAGLAAVVAISVTVFTVIRLAGAVVPIVLGIRLAFERR